MGLLDAMAGQVLGSLTHSAGDRHSGLVDAIGGLLTNAQAGGLQGLIRAFQREGLGGVMDSWIGTGNNQPISPDQLQSVLGAEQIQAIARQLGVSPQETSGHLAELLPQIIDRLTPGGAVPAGGMLGGLLDALKRGIR